MISLIKLVPFFLLAQESSFESSSSGNAPGPIFWICEVVFIVLMIAAMWKVFSKAGEPGWAALIPIFNVYVMCKVAGRPGWWLLLFLIPFVNVVVAIIVSVDISKR